MPNGSVAAGFAPWRVRPHQVRPHIDSTSDQVLKINLSLTEKKDNIVRTMKHNHTKHVYLSFFNPLTVTDEFKIESSGWVHGGELGMRRNWCHSMNQLAYFMHSDWFARVFNPRWHFVSLFCPDLSIVCVCVSQCHHKITYPSAGSSLRRWAELITCDMSHVKKKTAHFSGKFCAQLSLLAQLNKIAKNQNFLTSVGFWLITKRILSKLAVKTKLKLNPFTFDQKQHVNGRMSQSEFKAKEAAYATYKKARQHVQAKLFLFFSA